MYEEIQPPYSALIVPQLEHKVLFKLYQQRFSFRLDIRIKNFLYCKSNKALG